MCECIAQLYSSDAYLHCLAHGAWPPELEATQSLESIGPGGSRACPDLRDHDHIIRPNHRLAAVMNGNGELCWQHVRWGWSPVWSMGTRPPLTHLPLEIVMRSKVFERMRSTGRAVVAVDGWFDFSLDNTSTGAGRFTYKRPVGGEPTYLAALAQVSESPSGCNGLVLVTYGGGGALGPLQLLALDRDSAMRWLEPSLDWQQAMELASSNSDVDQTFETVAVRQRFNVRR
jgi:putative SOS response-associated peptidase YedK